MEGITNINPITVLEKGILKAPHDYPIITDLKEKECQISSNGIDLRINETITLQPGKFKNVELMERFNMDGVFGAIWTRSSFSRRGIFHTAGLFDDGFGIGIEGGSVGGVSLYNMGEDYVTIEKGTRICQMVFFESDPAKKYNGFYNQNQTIKSQYEKSE